MVYCASCPELASHIQAVTTPHNKVYWATVILITTTEFIISLFHLCFYGLSNRSSLPILLSLSSIILVLDVLSIRTAYNIYNHLKSRTLGTLKRRRRVVPKPLLCVFHFVFSFITEWVRFYSCVVFIGIIEEDKYPKTIVAQFFICTIMSFWTLRQMIYNTLIWINSTDCQYVINSIFTHTALVSSLFYVLIHLCIHMFTGAWDEGDTDGTGYQLVLISVASQIIILVILVLQKYFQCGRKRTSIIKIKPLPKHQEDQFTYHGAKKRHLNPTKHVVPSSMANVFEFDPVQQEKSLGLDPLNEDTLLKSVIASVEGSKEEWIASTDIESDLRWKIHFYSWTEYGYIDVKHFFVSQRKHFSMKLEDKVLYIKMRSSIHTKKGELMKKHIKLKSKK